MPRHNTNCTSEELESYSNSCIKKLQEGGKISSDFYLGAHTCIEVLQTMEGTNPVTFMARLERLASLELGLYEEVE